MPTTEWRLKAERDCEGGGPVQWIMFQVLYQDYDHDFDFLCRNYISSHLHTSKYNAWHAESCQSPLRVKVIFQNSYPDFFRTRILTF